MSKRNMKQRIEDSILPYRSGVILNAYYDQSGSAYVDAITRDENGGKASSYIKVPILKVGGFSMSLPPAGATAILGFIDNDEAKPFLIGYVDSDINQQITTDDKTPRKPPTILTR